MPPRIKICCISSIHEAKIAINYGASAIGLVGKMPSGPGVISDELICTIAKSVPPPVATFLLTSETSSQEIVHHQERTRTNTIQIVDRVEYSVLQKLRDALPSVKLVQVIHVINEHSIEEAIEVSLSVDALLLDSGNPNLSVKKLGGTGRVHNWKLSRIIVENISIPVFLAGGLNADNAQRAFDEVHPFGLDICSGVRTNGKLDEKKLAQFFKAIA